MSHEEYAKNLPLRRQHSIVGSVFLESDCGFLNTVAMVDEFHCFIDMCKRNDDWRCCLNPT